MLWRKDIPRINVVLMIKQSRYLAFVFILVLTLPGVFAPTSSDIMGSQDTSPTVANWSPLDLPIQTSQDFEGDLNQSITILGNESLVPYRVDVNVTNLNRTGDRLSNGDFEKDLDNWQVPNVPGKTFLVNESGPAGARSLQGNFTGIWNTTKIYPLNETYHVDQFDEPEKWQLTQGTNVSVTIDGFSNKYLNFSWWKDIDPGSPEFGFDKGTASRTFSYSGSPEINEISFTFRYYVSISQQQGTIQPPYPNSSIRCNVTIANPDGDSRLLQDAIVETYPPIASAWTSLPIWSADLKSIFGKWGEYTITINTSIEHAGLNEPLQDHLRSQLIIDNVSLMVNTTVGSFNALEGTNVTQYLPLSQPPLNDTKVTLAYCISALPEAINHNNVQLGFAINNTWVNVSALSDMTLNSWGIKSIWVGNGNFTGTTIAFKLGLMSFNASEIFPNQTLLVHFANISLEMVTNTTAAGISLCVRETNKNAPLIIVQDIIGNINSSVDYSSFGGFGLGTSLNVHLNATLTGGVRGQVTVYSWTWREALWRSLNKSLTALETYIATLPNTYANLFSNSRINFTHINFARAMEAGDSYLARTYASQVGPNALYTTSIVNASQRLLWSALGNPSLGVGVPGRVSEYIDDFYEARQNSSSLVGFLQSDPRWGWVQANATLARDSIYTALSEAPAKVPLYMNASTLVDWASALQISVNCCVSGASWTIPEPAWTGGKSQLFIVGYSKMATSNLQRPTRPAFPILTTATQYVGGAPLLATLAQPTNGTASWNYLTQAEFHFVAYFDAILGYLAECTSIAQFLVSIPNFIAEGTRTPASKYQYEQDPKIDIIFSSDHFGSPELAITASWQGNASSTSGWIVNGLYALRPSAPVLLWEQALPVEDIAGTYTRTLQWLPPTLPPALNELYVDAWDQNWTAPIALRSAIWIGGREVFMNLGIQQETSEKWFNISGFSILTREEGNPVNVSQINQTQQAGDWCLLTSRGAASHLDFRESGGKHVGYNPWSVFSNTMGSNATYNEMGNRTNLLSLRGSWAGDLFLLPSPVTKSQFSIGQVITKFSGIPPYFAGIANGTLFLTPRMGETTFNLSLPAWEGTRTYAITGFTVAAQIISKSSPDISVTNVQASSTISRASFGAITLSFRCPTKPIGHQFELLLTLSGNAEGGIPIQREVLITVEFVDVISPQPPIPDSLFLAILAIIGSFAVALFIVRWHRFLFFRSVIREEPRSYKE